MMARINNDDEDPELVDIDELSELERTRHHTARHVRTRSTALILVAVGILLVLGIGSAWIAGAF